MFKLHDKFEQSIDYDIEDVSGRFIGALASVLTDEEYHELAHQLHGSKSEYDRVDGEVDGNYGSLPMAERKFRVVKDSLYRGVFWKTLKELEWLENE